VWGLGATVPRRLFLIAGAVLISCTLDVHGHQARRDSHCDAPVYFGICDPYVPGTRISFEQKQPIRVVDTWHDGPAERSGICPGDKIVAVNGVLASENTSDRMLHEIVSTTPSPVLLTVKRGEQTMEFRVRRVRESTLAKLSHQRYMVDENFRFSEALVPLGEKRAEHARYVEFLKQLEERQGFTRIDDLAVPVGTPPLQVARLKDFLFGGQEHFRRAGSVGPTAGKYSCGFTALVLKEPGEVLIEAVLPNSPAHRAGLLPGDRVLGIDGKEVSGMAVGSLRPLLLEPDQERTISVEVDRGGEEHTLQIRAQRLDQVLADDLTREMPSAVRHLPDDYFLGIGVLYSPNPRREAMVASVDWPSAAFEAGLHVGDSMVAVNGRLISGMSQEEFGKLLVPSNASSITLEVSRLGRTKTFTVRPLTYRSAEAAIGRKWTNPANSPGGPPPRPVPEACPSS
jgi:C-terminal processing protease CtpA/Prc